MALGSEVNDNKPHNGTNEIKGNKSVNKSPESSAGDQLKKAKKQQKSVNQKVSAGAGGGKSKMKVDASSAPIINGHPKEEDTRKATEGDVSPSPSVKQNGHHALATSESNGHPVQEDTQSCVDTGGKQKNSTTPSYAAAAAKLPPNTGAAKPIPKVDASRTNSVESSPTVSSPEVTSDTSLSDACALNPNACRATTDKDDTVCSKPVTNKTSDASPKTTSKKSPDNHCQKPNTKINSDDACQKKADVSSEVCKKTLIDSDADAVCAKPDKKSSPDNVSKMATKTVTIESSKKTVTKSTTVDENTQKIVKATADEASVKKVIKADPDIKASSKTTTTDDSGIKPVTKCMSDDVCQKSDVSDVDSGIASSPAETIVGSDSSGATNGEATGDEEGDDKKGDQEVLFIQDVGFTVKIVSPGAQPFDIQVSSMELVQEIHQLLMDREDTCHRTCFSLQLDGNALDNFAEVKNIEGLKEGSVIKVAEEPYTVREARIHVRHVRDLLKSLDSSDAYTGTECNSLAFLNVVTQGDILEKKKTRPESVDCTPPDYIMPGSKERPLLPLHPITKESKGPQCIKVLTTSGWNPPPGPRKMNGDLLYLHVVTMEDRHFHITACARGFYLNQSSEEIFNPKAVTPSHLSHSLTDLLASISPAFKRSFGTVQRRRTQKHPFERVATPYQVYSWVAPIIEHTVDAIRAEDNFSSKLGYEEHIPGQTRDWNEELQTTRELPRKNLPERLLRERAIFKVHSDFVAAATRGAMAVVDGNVMAINPGEEAKMQMFIWNNIFFSLGFDVRDHYKELGGDAAAFVAPRNDLQGVRVYSAVDLEGLYTLGTVVIDYRGFRVTAQSIIPGILEKEQEQSVIYGSIDFGKTVLTHPKYMELLSKAGKQLKILPHSVMSAKGESVELCSSVECKGIVGNDGRHYILDLLRTFPPDVNFLKLDGVELSPQVKAIGFPIEHKHKLCCLRQELVDSFVEARYLMFIRYTAFHFQQLGIKKQKDKESSGADNKKAIEYSSDNSNVEQIIDDKLDEVNKESQPKEKVEIKEKLSKSDKKIKKDLLKKEAEDAKAAEVSQNVPKKSESDESLVSKKVENEEEKKDEVKVKFEDPDNIDMVLPGSETEVDSDEGKKIVESIIDSISNGDKQEMADSTRDIVKAAAKSVGSLKEAEFDIRFNPDVFSDGILHACSDEELEKQRRLVQEAAAFLVTTQIPTFIRECMDHSSAPMDGSTLADALHTRGINMRYLGRVCDLLALVKSLSYLHTIAVSEIILRAAKHIFTAYVQACELMSLSQAISHFLNCLLGSAPAPTCAAPEEARAPRRRARRRPARYTGLTPKALWTQIKQELKSYWGWVLPTDSIDSTVEKYGFQKISLLRSFCIKVGLQILLREYDFDSKHKVTFNSSDIMNIFPVVKHINPRASDAYNFYTTGQSKIQAGQVRDGHELITEALNLLNNVYGAMHPEIAQCLRMVARLCYVTGEHREAMAYQQKAVLMSERVNGIDHPYTITEYTHLALYCFANGQVSSALKLLYRARYLALLVCGENHPEIALLDSNISLILHAVGEYELSLRFLERASALTAACHGARSLKAAAARHLLARTLSCLGDFRAALQHERETYSIYKQQLGEAHEKTRESSDCLRHLTHQAVVLQKKMNDICSGRAAGAPPIHIQPPSMGSVLDMLNVINGILFVQISQQDIEHFKAEIEKRQLKENSPESTAEEPPSTKVPTASSS